MRQRNGIRIDVIEKDFLSAVPPPLFIQVGEAAFVFPDIEGKPERMKFFKRQNFEAGVTGVEYAIMIAAIAGAISVGAFSLGNTSNNSYQTVVDNTASAERGDSSSGGGESGGSGGGNGSGGRGNISKPETPSQPTTKPEQPEVVTDDKVAAMDDWIIKYRNKWALDSTARAEYAEEKGISSWPEAYSADGKVGYMQFKSFNNDESSTYLYVGPESKITGGNPWRADYICDTRGLCGTPGQWYKLPKTTYIAFASGTPDKVAEVIRTGTPVSLDDGYFSA